MLCICYVDRADDDRYDDRYDDGDDRSDEEDDVMIFITNHNYDYHDDHSYDYHDDDHHLSSSVGGAIATSLFLQWQASYESKITLGMSVI